jgi:uncharacterized protein
MNCPVCNIPLTMTDRSGVEIDYCQKCRGVWLDRGELDKIIERSSQQIPGSGFTASNQPHNQQGFNQHHQPPQQPFQQQQHYPDSSSHYGHHKKHKKRESWLGEMFDFD